MTGYEAILMQLSWSSSPSPSTFFFFTVTYPAPILFFLFRSIMYSCCSKLGHVTGKTQTQCSKQHAVRGSLYAVVCLQYISHVQTLYRGQWNSSLAAGGSSHFRASLSKEPTPGGACSCSDGLSAARNCVGRRGQTWPTFAAWELTTTVCFKLTLAL